MSLLFYIIGALNFIYLFVSSGNFFNGAAYSLVAQVLLIANTVPLVIALLAKGKSISFWKKFGLLLLMAAVGVISFLAVKIGSAYDYFVNFAGYLAIPIYMAVIPEAQFKSGVKNWFQCMSVLYTVLFLFNGIVRPILRENATALTMGYTNPNRTGLYLLMTVVLTVIAFVDEQGKVKRMVSLIAELSLIYLIILTQCRTAFLLSVLLVLYVWLPKAPTIKRKWINMSVIFPLVFIGMYMWLYNIGLLRDMTILDRDVYTGREELFAQQLQGISLLGNSFVGFDGLNVPLAVLSFGGVIGLALFYWCLYNFTAGDFLLVSAQRGAKNIPAACFIAILLHGCTERSLFTGGAIYASMVGCILMLIGIYNSQHSQRTLEESRE